MVEDTEDVGAIQQFHGIYCNLNEGEWVSFQVVSFWSSSRQRAQEGERPGGQG